MFLFRLVRDLGSMNAAEALRQTYEILVRRYAIQTISMTDSPLSKMAGGAVSEIADDSDDHRTRKGFMAYESIAICEFDSGVFWIVAHGKKSGQYPGNQYESDIMAFRYRPRFGFVFPLSFGEREYKELVRMVGGRNDRFESSLVIAMTDGRLKFQNSALRSNLELRTDRFVLSSEERFGLTLAGERVSIGRANTYHRDFPRFLSEQILDEIRRESPRRELVPA